jgi:hypothetical protein
MAIQTETERGGLDWIDLAQGRDQWRILVRTVLSNIDVL